MVPGKQIHKDMVLYWFMHHMTQETRRKLMVELPAAYNDITQQEVVMVVHKDDGTPVAP